jgi:hypothetical protein
MNDAERLAVGSFTKMRVVQPLEHLAQDIECRVDWRELAPTLEIIEQRAQIFAGDVLHRDVVRAGDGAEVEHLADIGMVQLRGDARLVDQHLHELVVLVEPWV